MALDPRNLILQSSATHGKYFWDSDLGISGFILQSEILDFLQAKCGSGYVFNSQRPGGGAFF